MAGLYVAAVLIPLVAFVIQLFGGSRLGRLNAWVATGAIGLCCALSVIGFLAYFSQASEAFGGKHHAEGGEAHSSAEEAGHDHGEAGHEEAASGEKKTRGPLAWTASMEWVSLGAMRLVVGPNPGETVPLKLSLGVYIDNLAVIMFLMVTFIATLIHVFSMGYMHDDPRYPRFFTYLSLFCFSMLGLVASANVFMIFVFWELVGVCSYLLIGFWYEDKKNTDAANKAFITNRVGDVGMLMGLGILWSFLGTFDIHELNTTIRSEGGRLNVTQTEAGELGDHVTLIDPETHKPLLNEVTNQPRRIGYGLLILAGIGIFMGCMGKSAQFPLHVWLPDAMAGPTPVSALIHAATMVAAGVYLVGRFYPVFTPEVSVGIGYIGGITLFIAATIAMVQTDYKKVLAYSTVSQLGFMMLGLGVGGWAGGLFHLLTHAFFKALLFLGAGSVYHSVHTYEMPVLGGLLPKMRTTALTMLAATMAISGVPLFSGFFSKDAILAASIHFVFAEGNYAHILLFLLPTIGAAITAFYMFRLWFLVFAGTSRSAGHGHVHGHGHDDHHGHGHGDPVAHAHESGPLMAWPLKILAVPTVLVGVPLTILPIPGFHPILENMLAYGEPVPAPNASGAHLWAMLLSLIIATVGIGLAVLYYGPWPAWRKLDAAKAAARFPKIYDFLKHKWYFDELYAAIFVRPCMALARGASAFDRNVIDGLVNGSARSTAGLSRLEGVFDNIAVDGLVNLVAKLVYKFGDVGRRLQTGRLRSYIMVLAIGVVFLFAGVFAWVVGYGV